MRRPAIPAEPDAGTADGPVLVWALRASDGGASGLEFARATVAAEGSILVHAAPSVLDVEVFENGERSIASAKGLGATDETPMTRLTLDGRRVLREQIWPAESDLGTIVVLPGGEAGRLESWATDPERVRWIWSLEFRGGEA